ncbi:unnamed protein product [Closterium sp. NIES-65]|nr:unnamed protein product [Closterium sp. NIES-65]
MSELVPPEPAGHSARVSVEVVSARGLRNKRKLPFTRMSPCALVSLPGRPSCWKALPPAVNGGRNPTWGGGPQFTAEFEVDDLLPRSESSPQQPSASAFPSESSFPASPISSASADHKSTASTFPSPASSAAASFPPAALPPHARAQVRVELFSSATLRKSLGSATVALDAAFRRPGEWQLAQLPVMRSRCKGGDERAKQSGWVTVRVRVWGVAEAGMGERGMAEGGAACWQPPLAPIPSFYTQTGRECDADVDGADVDGVRREGVAAAAGVVTAGSAITPSPSPLTPPPPPPVTGYPAAPPYSHTVPPHYPPNYPSGPYAQPTSSTHPYTAYAGPSNPPAPWYPSSQAPPVTVYKHSKHGQKRRAPGRAGLGAGLALGALGGLLVGDAIGDSIGDGLGDAGGFDFGGFEPAGHNARVCVEVVSAHGLRNERKPPFARMSPCALVSLPGRPSCWKALPPAVNGGRNPTWGGGPQFTAEFAADDLLPHLDSSSQQPASSLPSESPFPASPLSSASADYISSTAATLLSSASSAAASFPPAALPPHARAQVRVELFSSASLRKSLGAATVALDAALRRPGEWQCAELPVMRGGGDERVTQCGWVTVRVRIGGTAEAGRGEGGRAERGAACWQPPCRSYRYALLCLDSPALPLLRSFCCLSHSH